MLYRSVTISIVTALVLTLVISSTTMSRELTLNSALEFATAKSERSKIINGDLEVAQQEYNAERINFILPEISINGSVPAYNVTESFRFFGGADTKSLTRTTDLNFASDITLAQSLITGGNLTVKANLLRAKSEYPLSGVDVDEDTRQGIFDFTFEQPLLKPSSAKNDLRQKKTALQIAQYSHETELADLKREIVEAYFGLLQMDIHLKMAADQLTSARDAARIDSIKFSDAVISEEDYLETASKLLDAELNQFDIENQRKEKARELALLLDLDVNEELTLLPPPVPENLTDQEKKAMLGSWEQTIPLLKASAEYDNAKRAADFAAGSHGLTGTLQADYRLGRGNVDVTGYPQQDNNTNSWGLSLNFSLPLWDGGSSAASVKAAQISAEKSRIEYERAEKSARAQLIDLINRIDVSHRKLNILRKQIDLTSDREKIAKFRFDDGQISIIDYVVVKVEWLQAQNDYYEELKNYLVDKIDLDGKFTG